MSDNADRTVIACNYAEGTKIASLGALAYFCDGWTGGGYERVRVLVRSRGGRWVKKWESVKRLRNFRLKTLPASHPRYADKRVPSLFDDVLTELKDARNRYA